jgi:hypothetical protein
VINKKKNTQETRVKQGPAESTPEAYKIGASTPHDFEAHRLTAYGGLLPVAVMLEKLRFTELLEDTLSPPKRRTRVMSMAQFITALVLAFYVGFSRLAHLRFLEREPMLVGIVRVSRLPLQSTFWRFLASLHLEFARQLGKVQARLRQRVWDAANVRLTEVTLDTDTTVHTIYGQQMGGRKGYNPKHKGKQSYQPILTFLAETREFVGGELHNGDRPDGQQIARHLHEAIAALPESVKTVRARADSGFYCREAVQAYEEHGVQFILSARKTSRLVDELKSAHWTGSPRTDADGQCQFQYQPEGWPHAYRFVALRYEKKPDPAAQAGPQQYQLFDTPEYSYRVFVTNLDAPIDALVWFYNQRAGAENLIKEANNDAGLTAHPSGRWAPNCVHFQLAMLAYNLNCWLILFNREPQAKLDQIRHTTLATTRLRFLFLGAKIRRHAGRVSVSFSDHYPDQTLLNRLIDRLRSIVPDATSFGAVLADPLRS